VLAERANQGVAVLAAHLAVLIAVSFKCYERPPECQLNDVGGAWFRALTIADKGPRRWLSPPRPIGPRAGRCAEIYPWTPTAKSAAEQIGSRVRSRK
jgi:hypothetical protein